MTDAQTETEEAPVEESFFHTRDNPWYGVGTVLDDPPDVAAALTAAGLDWEVERRALFHRNGGEHEIEDKYAVVRTDTNDALGLVGRNYKTVQNRQAFEFANTLLDGGVKFDSAGSYRGGRRVFLVARIEDEFMVDGEDPYGVYLLIVTSHDGTLAVTAVVTPIRLRCKNQLNLALRKAKTRWKLRHTSTFEGRVMEAREALRLTHKAMGEFNEEMRRLMALPMNDVQFKAAMEKVLPDSARRDEKIEQLEWILHESPNLEGYRDNRYGGLQAFTEWLDWGREIRTEEARFQVSFDGYGSRQRNSLYKLLISQ